MWPKQRWGAILHEPAFLQPSSANRQRPHVTSIAQIRPRAIRKPLSASAASVPLSNRLVRPPGLVPFSDGTKGPLCVYASAAREHPCNKHKVEVCAREGHWIKEKGTWSKFAQCRTKQQWHEDNEEAKGPSASAPPRRTRELGTRPGPRTRCRTPTGRCWGRGAARGSAPCRATAPRLESAEGGVRRIRPILRAATGAQPGVHWQVTSRKEQHNHDDNL